MQTAKQKKKKKSRLVRFKLLNLYGNLIISLVKKRLPIEGGWWGEGG